MCMHSYEHVDQGGSGTEANTPILEKNSLLSHSATWQTPGPLKLISQVSNNQKEWGPYL